MVLCFAACCSHQSVRNQCSFYRFPKDKKTHRLWTKLSRRADREPGSDARLCSCHFKDGKKENGPTIFGYTKQKAFDFSSPEKKKKKVLQDKEPVPCAVPPNNSALLAAENYYLKKRIEELEAEIKEKQLYFKFAHIREHNNLVLMYTGLPNAAIFDVILNYIKRFDIKYYYDWTVNNLTLEDQLFITLQKLRQNYTFVDLSVRYSVSETTIRNVFYTFVHALHEALFEFVMWDKQNMPSLSKIQKTSPIVQDFPNCRFLIDCTEIYIETPRKSMEAQRHTYSNYKKRQTLKALVAVTPSGTICFTSNLHPGSASDKFIFENSGLSELLKPGDLVIADKGFLIHSSLPKGVSLNIPPFLLNPQFTEQEAKYTTQIARARIHVERAIQRIKSFEILSNISHNFRSLATKIFQVCVVLVNFQTPIIEHKE